MAEIEIRRKKKFDGDEDPIVIAQRFLNIFHQLHIFNDEKKNEFNNMIIKLPEGVLSMLNSLPGGGMLLDYVEDLEQKAGITSTRTGNGIEASSLSNIDEEVSKAKILATALAEAQIQANAKMQAAGMNMVQPQAAPVYNQPAQNIHSKVEIGADFSIGLAQAIASAMEISNNQHKDDMKSFVQNLGQTQLEIIKILQQDNNERKKETLDLTKMLSESQQKIALAIAEKADVAVMPSASSNIAMENHADLAEFLKASQQQTNQILMSFEKNRGISSDDLTNFAKLSQQQFSQAMLAINENRRADTMEIANVMKESQLEVAKMLIQNNAQFNNNNAQANNIEIHNNTSDNNTQQLADIVEKLVKLQVNNTTNIPTHQMNFDMSGLENMLTQLVKSQSQLYREVSSAQTKELAAIISVALKESQQISSQNIIMAIERLPKVTQVVERIATSQTPIYEQTVQKQAPVEEFATELEIEAEEAETIEDNQLQENLEVVEETPKKKKKKKKKKNREVEAIMVDSADTLTFEQEAPLSEDTEEISSDDDFIYVEEPTETVDVDLGLAENQNEDIAIENWLNNEIIPEATPTILQEESASDIIDINTNEFDIDLSEFENQIVIDDKAAEDWGWNTPTEDINTSKTEEEWEYEEENTPILADGEGEEWEWEYEEETTDEQNIGEEQDWEWEYEEVPDNNVNEYDTYNLNSPSQNVNLIDENSTIYSRELYFQENVYNAKGNYSNLNLDLPLDANIMIKNLEERDANDDPYKDYEVKD